MIDNVRDVFSRFCVFQRIFRLVCIPLVVQKQTLGEVGSWMIIWWQVVSGIFTNSSCNTIIMVTHT